MPVSGTEHVQCICATRFGRCPPPGQVLILLEPNANANNVTQAVQRMGGHVTHVFPSAALIGQVSSDIQP